MTLLAGIAPNDVRSGMKKMPTKEPPRDRANRGDSLLRLPAIIRYCIVDMNSSRRTRKKKEKSRKQAGAFNIPSLLRSTLAKSRR